MIKFFYKKEVFDGTQSILRPIADIYLKSKIQTWIKFHPYIDSGADITLIPKSLGELLGLVKIDDQIKYLGGIRGSVPVIYTKVYMRIGQKEFLVRVAWALTEQVPPLLGRRDVFDHFDAFFKQRQGMILFKTSS